MADSLDDLEKQAAERKARGRNPGGSRHPRPTKAEREARAAEDRQKREAERKRREEERRQEAAAKQQAQTDAEAARQAEQGETVEKQVPGGGGQNLPASTRMKRLRPDSQTWYPDPDNVDFLWEITEAATNQREKVPATAVIRFALRRLQDQMSPDRIVQELSGPVQTEGKLGRPRR